MALNASKVKGNSGPRAPVLDAGAYPARLVGVIDLGLQPQEYKGESKPPKNEIQIIYESSDEFMPGEDGEPDESKPRWFWESFPLNHIKSEKAKSTARYLALDPTLEFGGDWSKLVGRPVNVGLTRTKSRDGNEYNNVGATSSMRPKEADKLPELVNDPILFDMSEPDVEVFLALPERLQNKIKDSLEFDGSELDKLLEDHKGGGKKEEKKKKEKKEAVVDDEVPFESDNNEENEENAGEDNNDW